MIKYLLLLAALFLIINACNTPSAGKHSPAATDTVTQHNAITPENDTTPFLTNFNFWILLPLLLIAVITFFGYKAYRKLKYKIGKLERRVGAQGNVANTNPTYATVEAQKREISSYINNNETIAGFQDAIFALQKRLSALEMPDFKQKQPLPQPVSKPETDAGSEVQPGSQQNKNRLVKNEVFYMTLPINDYFLVKSKSMTKDNTIYKFTVKPNNQEADFFIHVSGSQLNDILSMVESYIKPACDEENLPGSNVRNIITTKPGLAKLEGDKWIIIHKAIIRYE